MVIQSPRLCKPNPDEIATIQARTGMDYLQARAHLIGHAHVVELVEQERKQQVSRCLDQWMAARAASDLASFQANAHAELQRALAQYRANKVAP